jgi:hypothetical protein
MLSPVRVPTCLPQAAHVCSRDRVCMFTREGGWVQCELKGRQVFSKRKTGPGNRVPGDLLHLRSRLATGHRNESPLLTHTRTHPRGVCESPYPCQWRAPPLMKHAASQTSANKRQRDKRGGPRRGSVRFDTHHLRQR